MERDYDLFEVMPNGDPIWRETVSGHENAIQRLRELAKQTVKRGSRDAYYE